MRWESRAMLSSSTAFWRRWIQPLASPLSPTENEQWTREILAIMGVIAGLATGVALAAALSGLASWEAAAPAFAILGLSGLGFWLTQRGGWRRTRYLPAVICVTGGLYYSFVTGPSPEILFALGVLLAGALVTQTYQGILILLTMAFSVTRVYLLGPEHWQGQATGLIALAFILIGFAELQRYYQLHIQRSLVAFKRLNLSLSNEATLRQDVQAALLAQEKQLRRLADNTSDLICEIDPDGLIRYASPSYRTLLGYDPADLVGTDAFALIHPDQRPAAVAAAVSGALARQAQKMALRVRRLTGDYIEMETLGNPIYDAQGQLEGFVLSSRDLRERQEAESALRQSEAKFRSIINATPMGIHSYRLQPNGDLILTDFNPAAQEILGIDHAPLVGQAIEAAFPGLAGSDLPERYREAARSGTAWHSTDTYHDDGINGNFETYVFQTAPNQMVAMFRDITESVRAEIALRKSEEKFSKAFITSPDSININRLHDGMYIDINLGFTRLTGYEREEVVGKSSLELNIWADPADRARLVQELRRCGEVENLEARFRFKDGTVKTGLMSARLLEINDEMCILSFTRDISERLQAEQALRLAHIQLAEAYAATLEGWVRALELREHETADHSRRVVDLTLKMARHLGIEGEELEYIQRGALLHDIGKIGVPDSILLKPGPLTPEEWAIMRFHPTNAYELMAAIPFLMPSVDIPYCHHEHWNGQGYPRGIVGEAIPLAARIFAIVDVYDALLSDRPYRPAWPRESVLAYLRERRGQQFDPNLIDTFLELVNADPEIMSSEV
jgi:PAS domain S-box-containing protein